MATPTNLIAGATTFASAGWVDTSGFATAAAQLFVGAGSQNITAGLDQSAAQVILSLTVSPQFLGNIGNATTPLKFKATDTSAAEKTSANTEAFFLNRGSGTHYIQAGTTAGTDSVDNVIHAGSGTLWLVAGVFCFVAVTGGGTLRVAPGAVVQNLKVYNGTAIVESASSTNLTSVTTYDGGSAIVKRPVSVSPGTITIKGGSVTYSYDEETGTATTLVTQEAGRFYHNAGPVTTHAHNGGLHDVTGLSRQTTVTTITRTPASTFKGQRAGGYLTVTNDITKDFPIFDGS